MPKKKSRFTTIDYFIVFSCLAGAFISGALFWREYNHTLVKLNEEPVGTIIFKKNVAQRKFIDRGVWDRLKQASPVYNGDTIRTTEQSEAIVILQDTTISLTLYDSTMIQVFYNSKSGTSIDFSGGNFEVASEDNEIVISSGASTIVVNGQAKMNKNDDGFVLSVVNGEASFDGMEVEAGNILALDSDGKIDTRPVITMIASSPSASASEPDGTIPIVFAWNTFYFNPDTHVIVETSIDLGFTQIAKKRDVSGVSSVTIPLEKGNYWWRVYPAYGGSMEPVSWYYPFGRLEVAPAAAPIRRESPIPTLPPVLFGKNTEDWDDLDPETIANNNKIIQQIVQTLNMNGEYRLRIEGFANSEIDPSDTAARLLEQTRELQPLSTIRARAVRDMLTKLNVDPGRLEYYGFGGDNPVAEWSDLNNWWKNRRVEFKLLR